MKSLPSAGARAPVASSPIGRSPSWCSPHAFVVPTGSMAWKAPSWPADHVLVDRLVYAEPSRFALLPYQPVQRGDIIVFLYPEDIRKNYVKRVIGNRLHLDQGRVIRNGPAGGAVNAIHRP